jgi:transcriptional regulator with XRE-family HTH domain
MIAAKLEAIEQNGGITGSEIARLLDTTPETISRWRGGKTQPQQRLLEHLLYLDWLISELSELYRPEEARIWLYSPNKMLKGQRPVDLIARGDDESRDEVLRVISLLKDSAFA